MRDLASASAWPTVTGGYEVFPGGLLGEKYRIERVLGAGGGGLVLGARNLLLDERVAIKLLTPDPATESSERLLGEARAAAKLRSDHVVRIFDVGRTVSGAPYVVMEHLEGQDVAHVLRSTGSLPTAVTVDWLLQACEALVQAHRLGIVHRDLKPANLFLERRPDGSTRIKLLDFGIAKLPSTHALTSTNQMLGSPAYMAPEQVSDSRDVDARADVWGLGVIAYELLTAQRPFTAANFLELARRITTVPHVPAITLRPDMPVQLSQVIDRCLAKQRDERWQRVAELARAFQSFAPAHARALVDRIERMDLGADLQDTLGDGDAPSGPKFSPSASPVVRRERGARQAAPWVTGAVLVAGAALWLGATRGLWPVPAVSANVTGGGTPAPSASAPPPGAAMPAVPTPALPSARPYQSGAEPGLDRATLSAASPRVSAEPGGRSRLRGIVDSKARPPAASARRGGAAETAPAARRENPAPSPAAVLKEEEPRGGPLPIDRRAAWK